MMKSFFKKLAFVMALAMVVTLAAPAGSAFAASALRVVDADKKVCTTYELAVGETEDFAFWDAKNWTNYKWNWESSNEEVAKVDNGGVVTGLADGVATITVTGSLDGEVVYSGEVVVTVGEGEVEEVVADTFVAEQSSDKKIKLTFTNTKITKEEVVAGLGFYYYIGTEPVHVPLIKSVGDVKDGVVEVELYTLLTDGVTYGLTYGEEKSEFTAAIGEVKSIAFKYEVDKAYVNSYIKLTPVLKNAAGVDITNAAMAANGAYVTFELESDAPNGEYWLTDDSIWFNEVTAANVKIQYFGGYDSDGNIIVGPSISLPVVSKEVPPYTIPFTTNVKYTITNETTANFDKPNNKFAVGDQGYAMYIKVKDSEGKDVESAGTASSNSKGTFRFESANVSRLYVTDDGTFMPNAAGSVSVIVYFTPTDGKEAVVAVIPVTVSAKRAIAKVDLGSVTAKTIATETGYNTAEFEVKLSDALGKEKDGDVTVKCTTTAPKGAEQPYFEIGGVAASNGEAKATSAGGKVTIKVVGDKANISSTSTSMAQTYNFTVTANKITKSFSVTIRAPKLDKDNNFVASGYKVEFTGKEDIKITDTAELTLTATLNLLSNGVPVDTKDIAGAKLADPTKAELNKFYYTVTKGSSDITNKTTATGAAISIDLTTLDTGKTGIASGTSIDVVKKEQGTGTYKVVIYQAIGSTGATKPSSYKTITSNTFTVKDTQDTMSYAGKTAAETSYTDVEDIVMNCFKFNLGNATLDATEDYMKDGSYVIEIKVNANTVTDGNVCFVNSVDFYVLTESGAYVKYTVNVNDYVTIK